MKRLYNSLIPFAATLAVITFFFTVTASADGNHAGPQTTAEDAAADKDDENTIKNFVLHAKQHFEDIPSEDLAARSEFFRQVRNPGIWNHDSVYLIMLARDGRVINHGLYTETLFGDSLGDLGTVRNLRTKLESAQDGEAVCEPYTYKDISRRACAVEYQASPTEKNILIGGFDHDEKDEDIVGLECPDYEPEVTAAEVQERQTRESLEDFVEGATIRFGNIVELFATGSPEKIAEATKILQCFSRPGPWKDGSIYLFIMTNGADGTPPRVFLNGLNQELAGSPFVNILDEDGVDVGKEIIDTAGEDGKDGFVEYKWDDPLVDGDEVNESGMSPGTSLKVSYVKGKIFPEQPQQVYILGSGIYPKDDDDDGCAIAGADSEPGSIVFNMFLIMFSMVLAVSLARFRRK